MRLIKSNDFHMSNNLQGGKSARIVNCVLALKAYSDWKKGGGTGSWKLGANSKPATSGKHFVRKNSEPFMNSFSWTSSASEQCSHEDLSQGLSEAVTELVFSEFSCCFFQSSVEASCNKFLQL